jgi:short-subunit dehydrogenase
VSGHVLIVGAGPGLGLANARRFGEAGNAVHLIARSAERLEGLAAELAEAGVEVETSAVDLGDAEAFGARVAEIDERRPIDTAVFQPGIPGDALVDVSKVTGADTLPWFEAQVLGAMALGAALVPRMRERGSGSLIFVGGASARLTLQAFGNVGPVMAALRSYALTLSGALDEDGVFAAFFAVAGMIATGEEPKKGEVTPHALADRLYRLSVEQDARELLVSPDGDHVPKGAAR